MEAINILLIGTGSGIIFAIISILIINSSNSERYPIGGFLPALWMITDLGQSSKIEAAGLLIMGGITGFYIMLAIRNLKFEAFRNNINSQIVKKESVEKNTDESSSTTTVKGKSLAQFIN